MKELIGFALGVTLVISFVYCLLARGLGIENTCARSEEAQAIHCTETQTLTDTWYPMCSCIPRGSHVQVLFSMEGDDDARGRTSSRREEGILSAQAF